MPTRRVGSFSAVAMSPSFRLEVLVASIADGLAMASSLANSSRFACRFSKIASMMTSVGRGVLQRDGQAAHRADRGDVAAHHAGADDVDMPCGEINAFAQALHALLQEEDPDQVGGR